MQNSTPLPAPRPSQNDATLPIVTLSFCLRERLQGLADRSRSRITVLPADPREQMQALINEANRRTLPTVDVVELTPHDQDEFAFYDLVARIELLPDGYAERAIKLLQIGVEIKAVAAATDSDDIAF